MSGEHSVMGIVADSVSQVIELGGDDVAAPPTFGLPVRTDYLIGMGKVEKKFVLILDIARVLSAEAIIAPATQGGVSADGEAAFAGRAESRVVA
jgi:purine-binding chemotaxis protein CheW